MFIDKGKNTEGTLGICLKFTFAIARLLESLSDKFNIVLSFDGDDFIVSFYCVRDSEQWLVDNLDSYIDEAIFVITTKCV